MQSLSAPFTIEVNGKPICSIDTNAEDYTQAKVGTDAATFTLKDGRLQSGEWFLGRNLTEDRSMLPKKVFWFKAGPEIENRVQIVTASRNGESYQLKFAGACLMVKEDSIFADLLEMDPLCTTVKMQ